MGTHVVVGEVGAALLDQVEVLGRCRRVYREAGAVSTPQN